MIQASSLEKTEWISNALNESSLKAQLVMERYDKALSEWMPIDDLDTETGVKWGKSAKKYKYAQVTLTPKASDISFNVLNENARYSEGSGTAYSGKFDLNTRVRIKAGYLVPVDLQSTTETVFKTGGTPSSDSIHFHTQFTNGELLVDGSNFVRNTNYFTDLFGLGTVQYNQNPIYTPTGMYIFTKDLEGHKFRNVNDVSVSANSTKFKIYARSIQNLESAEAGQTVSSCWNYLGDSISGTVNFSVDYDYRYFQIAILPDGIASWGSGDKITDLNFTYETYIEYLYKDVFLLDSPTFTDPPAPMMPIINCKGRDVYKKALESSVNVTDINGDYLDDILKNLLDSVGMQYTTASIADLTSFGTRTLATGLKDTVKLDKIFEYIMQIISQDTARYQMFTQYDEGLDDNIFYLQEKPTNYETDFVFNYKHYKGISGYGKDYDKMLQRITMSDVAIEVDKLDDLDTVAVSGAGDYSFSWTGSACFLEFEITVGSILETETIINTSQTATGLDFTVSGTSPSFTIKAKGCKIDNFPVYSEFVNIKNNLERNGTSQKLINKLVNDTAEYKKIVNELMNDFSDPVQQINNLNFPYLHLLLPINTMCMNWSRFVFNDSLSYVTGIKYNWNIKQDSTIFNSDDSGLNFSDIGTFIYDDIMDYGVGYVYDMGISTPLSTDEEIDNASIMTYDLEVV